MKEGGSGCSSNAILFIVILFIVLIIYYFTVSTAVLIIGIVADIIIVMYSFRDGDKTSDSKLDNKELQGRVEYQKQQDIINLVNRCTDSYARRFDFSTFWSAVSDNNYNDPNVIGRPTHEFYLDRRFHVGILCVSYINHFINEGIKTGDYISMRRELFARKNMPDNIVFCCGGETAPQCVRKCVDEVNKLLSRQPYSVVQLRSIIDLVPLTIKKRISVI